MRLPHAARPTSVFLTAIAATRQHILQHDAFPDFGHLQLKGSSLVSSYSNRLTANQMESGCSTNEFYFRHDAKQTSWPERWLWQSKKKKNNSSTDNLGGENHTSPKAPHPHKLIFFFTKLSQPAAFNCDWKSPGQTAAFPAVISQVFSASTWPS